MTFEPELHAPAAPAILPLDEPPPDPAVLAEIASAYGIEILGPPPSP
jgi:hypothetical protein